MIITLTGIPGAGKSTIAKLLSEHLNVPWYSIGDLRGKMATERGLTIDELNKLGENEAFTDHDVDVYQTELGKKGDNLIMDGRLSWHFIPNSLKVFLDVDTDEAARRIFEASKQGLRTDEKPFESPDDVKQRIADRLASDQHRYEKYYQVNYLDRSNYDLVVDTTQLTPEQVVQAILTKLSSIS